MGKSNQILISTHNVISKHNPESVLVHCDSINTLNLINFRSSPDLIIQKHWENILFLTDSRSVYIPAFNYDFPRKKEFDLYNTPSQVGAISEFVRKSKANWRTNDPMFSFSVRGPKLLINSNLEDIKSFGRNSIFETLSNMSAGILLYGANFNSTTAIHHAESLLNVPYRYKKNFAGKLLINKKQFNISYSSHFRPFGKYLDYRWDYLLKDLIKNNIIQKISPFIYYLSLNQLINFWTKNIKEDIFYLIDNKSRLWVEPMLDK